MSEFIKWNGETHLTCSKCNTVKEQSEFRKMKGGLICISCRSCVNKKYERDPAQAHLNAIKCRAKKNNLPFNLTIEDLTIPDVCPVLNIPLNKTWGHADQEDNKDYSPSIDRIIPSLGYVKHNVRIISCRANRIKTDSSVEEIRLVYEYTIRELKKITDA